MRLFICEKPSQGRDYAKALGHSKTGAKDGYIECNNGDIVTWCFGHLLSPLNPEDYGEEYKTWSLDTLPILPKEKWDYVITSDKKKQYKIIKGLVGKTNDVYIASDADREGEMIVVSLLERMEYKGNRFRVWAGAQDEETLRAAIKSAKNANLTYDLYLAAVTRQKADWMYGMNLTRGMTVVNRPFIEGMFSLGRVQTATLALIVNRDLEIENFKPKDYFEMSCFFTTKKGEELKTAWDVPKELLDPEEKKCLDKDKVKEIFDKVKGQTGTVTVSEKKRKQEDHPLLFSLDSLSKECNSKFGMSAAEVLQTAQALYETHKATTYPRTDCEYINEEQRSRIDKTFESMTTADPDNSEIQDLISRADRSIKSRAWNSKKVSAHHAIVPNIAKFDMDKLNDRERKVYELIRRRYLAQFYPKAEVDSTKIEIMCEGERFKASGTMPVSAGWKEVIGKKGEAKELPVVDKGDELPDAKPKLESKKTKPPSRYTEGTLLDAMKNAAKFVEKAEDKKMLKGTEGIGTVATRPEVLETLKKRNYINASKKQIISSEKGRALVEYAPEETKSIAMTAFWESKLEAIAEGKLKSEEFVSGQEELLSKMIEDIKAGKCTLKNAVGVTYTCPLCNGGLRSGKSKTTKKKFWVCMNRDTCGKFYQDNRGKPLFPKEVDQGDVEHTCEVCNTGKLHRNISKKNTYYWRCQNSECKQIYMDNDFTPVIYIPEEVDQGTEEHTCFSCNKNKLTRKKGKYGYYWNCEPCKKNFKDNEETISPINPAEDTGGIEQGDTKFKCFSCKKEDLIRKKGQYGIYWNCSGCKKNFKDKGGDKIEPINPIQKSDFKCPNCKDGYLVEKSGKNGKFFGCNAYPKCKTIKKEVNGKPDGF